MIRPTPLSPWPAPHAHAAAACLLMLTLSSPRRSAAAAATTRHHAAASHKRTTSIETAPPPTDQRRNRRVAGANEGGDAAAVGSMQPAPVLPAPAGQIFLVGRLLKRRARRACSRPGVGLLRGQATGTTDSRSSIHRSIRSIDEGQPSIESSSQSIETRPPERRASVEEIENEDESTCWGISRPPGIGLGCCWRS